MINKSVLKKCIYNILNLLYNLIIIYFVIRSEIALISCNVHWKSLMFLIKNIAIFLISVIIKVIFYKDHKKAAIDFFAILLNFLSMAFFMNLILIVSFINRAPPFTHGFINALGISFNISIVIFSVINLICLLIMIFKFSI